MSENKEPKIQMGKVNRKRLSSAGNKIMVGAIPGALIMSNENGEVIAFTPEACDAVINALQSMKRFAKTALPYDDDDISIPAIPLPAPSIFYKKKD